MEKEHHKPETEEYGISSFVAQNFSQAGPSIQFGPAGQWIASLTDTERKEAMNEDPKIAEYWDQVYGDRIN